MSSDKSSFLKDAVIHTFSRFGGAFLALLLNVIVMRNLTAFDYGRFAFCLALMAIGVEVAGKGMDPAIIRLSANHLHGTRKGALDFLKAGFNIRLVATVALVVIMAAVGRPVMERYYSADGLAMPFYFAILGIIAAAPLNHLFTILQSLEKFDRWAMLNMFLFISRVLLVALALVFLTFNLSTVLACYVAATYASVLLAVYLTKPVFLVQGAGVAKGVYSELVGFSKWTMLSTVFYIIYSKADILLLAAYAGPGEAGVYSAAVMLTFAIDMLTVSMVSVLLPKVSRFNTAVQRRRYIGRAVLFSFALAIILLPVFFASEYLITLLGGAQFAMAAGLFKVLYLGPFFTIITAFSALVLYNLNYPSLTVLISGTVLLINITGHLILIPRLGAKGAAIVTLSSRIIEGCLTLAIVYYLLRKETMVCEAAPEVEA